MLSEALEITIKTKWAFDIQLHNKFVCYNWNFNEYADKNNDT